MTPTVLSVGGVTIPTGSGLTELLLQKVAGAIAGISDGNTVVLAADATSVPAAPAGVSDLVIPADYAGPTPIAIPPGYAYVVSGATVPLTGGDANTVVIAKDLDYSGGAGTVIGVGSGNLDETADNSLISFSSVAGVAGSNYAVTVTGNNDTVHADTGTSTILDATGAGTDILAGTPDGVPGAAAAGAPAATFNEFVLDPSSSLGGADTVTAASGTDNLVFVYGQADIMTQGSGNVTVVAAPTTAGGFPGIVTLNATGGTGTQEIFDASGGNLINAGLSTGFVGAAGSTDTTVYNAETGGADTIFALGSTDYTGGNAASLFFLGGTQVVTVSAATRETVFGGSGGGAYTVGSGFFAFDAGALGSGGADTLTGVTGSASVGYFGASGENLTVDSVSGTFVTFGDKETINATNASGGDTFQIFSTSLDPSSPAAASFTGDTTLLGSNAGNDLFSVIIDDTQKTPHTITVSNWQASDHLFVGDFSLGEQLNSADLAAVHAFEGGAGSALTLSDGTTISFTDAKPTNILHN